jgi:hypothetical protein
MADPNNTSDGAHLAYKSVFDGDPFPAAMAETGTPGPFDLFMGTSKIIAMNLLVMHFNETEGTFIDVANLSGATVQKGNTISTFNAGYSLAILKQVVEEFDGMELSNMIKNAVIAQSNFILTNLYDGNGKFFNSYTIGSGADNSATTVETQAAAIRGLVAAYLLTADDNFKNAADKGYEYLIDNFFVDDANGFRTTDGENIATYTPLRFAAISGALREARLVLDKNNSPSIYTRFFKTVGNKMQLSEGGVTGESGNDSDGDGVLFIPEQTENLPPVFASEASYNLSKVTSVENELGVINSFELSQNYPNPFNPSTIISFQIPTDNFVSLKVYNILGAEVATLVNENKPAGSYNINFDASNLSAGIYLYKIKAGNFTAVKKLTFIK